MKEGLMKEELLGGYKQSECGIDNLKEEFLSELQSSCSFSCCCCCVFGFSSKYISEKIEIIKGSGTIEIVDLCFLAAYDVENQKLDKNLSTCQDLAKILSSGKYTEILAQIHKGSSGEGVRYTFVRQDTIVEYVNSVLTGSEALSVRYKALKEGGGKSKSDDVLRVSPGEVQAQAGADVLGLNVTRVDVPIPAPGATVVQAAVPIPATDATVVQAADAIETKWEFDVDQYRIGNKSDLLRKKILEKLNELQKQLTSSQQEKLLGDEIRVCLQDYETKIIAYKSSAGSSQIPQPNLKDSLTPAITKARGLYHENKALLQQEEVFSGGERGGRGGRGGRGCYASAISNTLSSAVTYLLHCNMLPNTFAISGGISRNLGDAFSDDSLYDDLPEDHKGKPYFDLEKNGAGFNILFGTHQARQYFKSFLKTFGITAEELDLTAPDVTDYENHTHSLQISHYNLPKFLEICTHEKNRYDLRDHTNITRKEFIEILLQNLYDAKSLDRKLLTLQSKHSNVAEYFTAIYYKKYYNNLQDPVAEVDGLTLNPEDSQYEENNPRRYMGALLNLYSDYIGLGEEVKTGLDTDLNSMLKGLAMVLLPYTPPEKGISRRLGTHLQQLVLGAESSPYCQLQQGGFFIYCDEEMSIALQEQLISHGIIAETRDNPGESSNSESDGEANQTDTPPDSEEYPKAIVIDHGKDVRSLLALAQIPEPLLDPTLDDLYKAKGLDYWELVLSGHQQDSLSKEHTTKVKQAQLTLAMCKNERKLVAEVERLSALGSKVSSSENLNAVQALQVFRGSKYTPQVIKSEIILESNQGSEEAALHYQIILDNSGSMHGSKWTVAKKAVRDLIKNPKTRDDTLISIMLFPQRTIVDITKDKIMLNTNAKGEILPELDKETPNTSTPLVEACVATAGTNNPTSTAADPEKVKNVRIILFTDGQGDGSPTGDELLEVMKTGVYRGQVKGTALGTAEVPYNGETIGYVVGIGGNYDSGVVEALGALGGCCHLDCSASSEIDTADHEGKIAKAAELLQIPATCGMRAAIIKCDGGCVQTISKPAPIAGKPTGSIFSYAGSMPLVPGEQFTLVVQVGGEYQSLNVTARVTDQNDVIYADFYRQKSHEITYAFYQNAGGVQGVCSGHGMLYGRGGASQLSDAESMGGVDPLQQIKAESLQLLDGIKEEAASNMEEKSEQYIELSEIIEGQKSQIASYTVRNQAENLAHRTGVQNCRGGR